MLASEQLYRLRQASDALVGMAGVNVTGCRERSSSRCRQTFWVSDLDDAEILCSLPALEA